MAIPRELTGDEIENLLREIPAWQLRSAREICQRCRIFAFPDYLALVHFTSRVARISDSEFHHPSLLLEWGKSWFADGHMLLAGYP